MKQGQEDKDNEEDCNETTEAVVGMKEIEQDRTSNHFIIPSSSLK